MGDPRWSSLFLKDGTPWEGPTLGQFVEDCKPTGRTHAGAVSGRLSPVGGATHWGRGREVRRKEWRRERVMN